MLRKKPKPIKPGMVGRTSEERDKIALKLLERARAGTPGLLAVWYGGGMAIAIKRDKLDEHPVAITWREAHRLAFPEQYTVEPEVPRKGIARFQGERKTRRIAV